MFTWKKNHVSRGHTSHTAYNLKHYTAVAECTTKEQISSITGMISSLRTSATNLYSSHQWSLQGPAVPEIHTQSGQKHSGFCHLPVFHLKQGVDGIGPLVQRADPKARHYANTVLIPHFGKECFSLLKSTFSADSLMVSIQPLCAIACINIMCPH